MVQEPEGAESETPLTVIVVDPATAATLPLQVVDKPFGVDTTKPLGSVSVNATPVSDTV
jgi:hypothetical protein